jgi:hypothetical protein
MTTGERAVRLAVQAELGHVNEKPSEASRKMTVPTMPPGLTHCQRGVSRFAPMK